jgi:hypothetical protein
VHLARSVTALPAKLAGRLTGIGEKLGLLATTAGSLDTLIIVTGVVVATFIYLPPTLRTLKSLYDQSFSSILELVKALRMLSPDEREAKIKAMEEREVTAGKVRAERQKASDAVAALEFVESMPEDAKMYASARKKVLSGKRHTLTFGESFALARNTILAMAAVLGGVAGVALFFHSGKDWIRQQMESWGMTEDALQKRARTELQEGSAEWIGGLNLALQRRNHSQYQDAVTRGDSPDVLAWLQRDYRDNAEGRPAEEWPPLGGEPRPSFFSRVASRNWSFSRRN